MTWISSMAVGAVVGAIAGAILGAVTYDPNSLVVDRTGAIFFEAIVIGVLGALAGLVLFLVWASIYYGFRRLRGRDDAR